MPPRPVIYFDRENPPSATLDRFTRLGIRGDNGFSYWGKHLENVPHPCDPKMLTVIESMTPAPVVVIDSLVAFFEGNENDPHDMRTFFRKLDPLQQLGVTIIIIHHTSEKSPGQDYRGSSDFRAAIDVGYVITNEAGATLLTNLTLTPFASRVQVTDAFDFKYDQGRFVRNTANAYIESVIRKIVCEVGEIKVGDLVAHEELKQYAYSRKAIRDAIDKMVNNKVLQETLGLNHSRILAIYEGK